MKAVILAAGYATRLHPLTLDKPKHLLELGDSTVIGHLVRKIEDISEIREIYVVTNNKYHGHFSEWAEGFESRCKIRVLNDRTNSNEDRLGAMGDLKFGIDEAKIDDDLLVVLGDNVFEFSLKEIHDFYSKKEKGVFALYDVGSLDLAKKYGVVELDSENRMTGFQEKPAEPRSTLSSTGIYFFPRKMISLFDVYFAEGGLTDGPGFFLEWLHKREDVYGFVSRKKWFDIGSLEEYERAQEIFSMDPKK